MRHFAVIAPAFPSHVRALEALVGELLDRGHRVSWLHQADVGRSLADPRIRFEPLGHGTHPPGSLGPVIDRAARPGGPWGIARVIADMAATTDMLCREAPAALDRCGAEVVIADQMEAAGGLVASATGRPFVSVACALPVNREPQLPLPVMPWGLARDEAGLRMNDGSARVYDWMMRPHARVIERHARGFGLPARRALHECLSPLLQLSQTTASFDFPRQQPGCLHHVGPLRTPGATAAALAFPPGPERDPRLPLVFASLGTLQGGRFGLLRRIAQACSDEGVQSLLAHCNRLDAPRERALVRAGATWVTGFAPQQAVLDVAAVAITHAGLNTAMDALAAGTPMLALPIAFDQPGVAARVVHAGAGVRIHPALAGRAALRRALRRLLDDQSFTRSARALGEEVRTAGGVQRAATLIERALDPAATAGGGRARDAVAEMA